MPDREGHIPPWMQVRDILRNKILSGELAPGAMVAPCVAQHVVQPIVAGVDFRLWGGR